jgi:hypothetical protein
MKNALFALAFGLLLSSCSPSWWQDFKNNPVTQIDAVLNTATAIENVATIAFNQLKQFLPSDQQPVFQEKFDTAVVALNRAMQGVHDAVQAAADAQQTNPDFTAVIADVVKAIQDIKDVVAEVRNLLKTPLATMSPDHMMMAPKPIPDPVGYDLMNSLADSVKK